MDADNKTTKVCAVCGAEKPVNEFPRHGRTADGRAKECKECRAKRIATFAQRTSISPIFHEDLASFAPRELLEHLKAIGYRGTLKFPHTLEL